MKVRINATGDTIIMKFLRPNADTKLEGYILGYGGSMFSKQFIQLPENGQPYETEMDAEPKYLIAVQPIPLNDVKKQCTGKVQVEKPLHLVIGSVTPTSVLLSWGTLLKTPYEGNIMNDCLEEGHYTVRYRERHRKWNYQTCPTSDTVIDNLKPNTAYEFGVQPNGPDRPGTWSKPVIHNTNIGGMQPQLSHINIVGFVVRRKENQNNFCLFVQAIHKQSLSCKRRSTEFQSTSNLTPTLLTHFLSVTRFDISENSTIFRSQPASDVDAMGKKRFVAPHVVYKTDKKPDEPCSITNSLTFFPDEEAGEQNATAAPRLPPTNLTVVTVEGCPSFVILDWEKSDNATREYKVISTTKGPHGEEVSILTTNQTHTAVENLKPESSYEFTVLPNNEHGSGPPSEPLRFETESGRLKPPVSRKDAIWTQFPFKADAYSECNGKQYVKRTWYRKFVGIQLCNSLRYKIYLSDSLNGKFYNIGDQTGHGEDHCQFVDSFLDGRTGSQLMADQLPSKSGFYRAMRQEPVHFGEIGGNSHSTYVGWYECGTPIPGKW
uniref:Fibronectin type-III domain-containing protein n=1 Tax=Gadus morhua TaxID=8049 RepID=A0A8C5ABB1_GADMO